MVIPTYDFGGWEWVGEAPAEYAKAETQQE